MYKTNLTLYPNPATDRITIDCSERINELSIYNLVGELVFQRQLNNNKNEIDVSNLSKGVYIIRVLSASGTMQQKLIKE